MKHRTVDSIYRTEFDLIPEFKLNWMSRVSGFIDLDRGRSVGIANDMDDNLKKRMIELALSKLSSAELENMQRLTEIALNQSRNYGAQGNLLLLLKSDKCSMAFKTVGVMVNRTWRALSQNTNPVERATLVKELVDLREKCAIRAMSPQAEGSTAAAGGDAAPPQPAPQMTLENAIVKVYEQSVGRTPGQDEINIWKNNFENGVPFHEFLLLMSGGEETKNCKTSKAILAEKSDGAFVQLLYELLHGRGCSVWEINHWVSKLTGGTMQRPEILAAIFNDAVKFYEHSSETVHDGLSCQILGTSRVVTADHWKRMAQAVLKQPAPAPDDRYAHRFYIKSEPRFLVTAIASLYRGGDFIEQFMDNLTAQSVFDDYCELVIVDADSPEHEFETIKRYLSKHKGINYIRMNYRIGIYDAWNVGVKAARGDYLTNTNLDDLRRTDSLEQQAAVLDNLPFVDVTYQDLYYTFDPRLSFGEIAAFGYETNLPIITPYNLMQFNSPHNAPMWRKRLHDELGYFNTHFKSAGDYEFWMRCLAAGKCFYKLNDPHVVYYQNPKGLSTRPDSRGIVEAKEIHKTYARKLVSENLVMPFQQFCREKLPAVPIALDEGKNDRYAFSQRALRNAARQSKYAAVNGIVR